jgi:hypothetical protein
MSRNAGSDTSIEQTRERLRSTRAELFELAHELRGDVPERLEPDHFPRSRIMRALSGTQGRVALATAALALVASRGGMALRVAGLAPLVRPLLMRFVLKRLMG